MQFKTPFIKPHFPSAESIAEDYKRIVEANWFTNFGKFEEKFRLSVENFLNNGSVVTTVANATLGLDIAIKALFDKNSTKNEVLMPSFTFAAGANAVMSNGYTPVFIDIDFKTWQPDINQAKQYINANISKVSGILFCNVFGVADDYIKKWEELAKKYNIPLLIDSAAGFGSKYKSGEYIGSRGDCEVFSLHATKPFGVGEGGLIASKSKELILHLRQLQNFGFDSKREVSNIGTNAKMQEINCAIGLKQLEGYEERLESRRQVLKNYKDSLVKKGFVFQKNDELSSVAFASVIIPDGISIVKLMEKLADAGIETKRYYSPLHLQKAFKDLSKLASTLKNTELISSNILSLPVHDFMEKRKVNKIINILSYDL